VAREQLVRAVVDLTGRLEEECRIGDQLRYRYTGIVQAFVTAEQVTDRQRRVDPRQVMGVKRVRLAELRLHLSDLGEETAGQRRERQKAFFNLEPLGRGGEEEIGPRVRIDDGLQAYFRFVQLKRRQRLGVVLPRRGDEVADDGNVGVEDLRQRRGVAVERQWPCRTGGARRSRRRFHDRHLPRDSRRRGLRRRGGRRLRRRFERRNLLLQRVELLLQQRDLRPQILLSALRVRRRGTR
jgi:hypothetical protein